MKTLTLRIMRLAVVERNPMGMPASSRVRSVPSSERETGPSFAKSLPIASSALKAERFIQTALREWAYAKAYERSAQRGADLPLWIHRYNWHRPHGSIGAVPPISRIGLTGNNLLRLHS